MSETTKKPTVQLSGEDGNAMMIIGRVRRALKQAGLMDEAEVFTAEAMAGDYDGVLRAAMKYCDVR